jgi:parallel beta-helix repeat protein
VKVHLLEAIHLSGAVPFSLGDIMKLVKGLTSSFLLLLVVSACSSLELGALESSELLPWNELEEVDATLSVAAVTTYYVSGMGSDSNTGTSSTKPFRTLQKAADLTNPGDIVYIMNGTYTNPEPDSIILNIARSGAPGQYIRYKAYPGHKPVLKATKNWLGIKVDGAAYILVEGLTVVGNNDNVTLAQALTQLEDTNGDGKPDQANPKPEYSGNGIGIYFKYENYAQPPHHVIIRNNTVEKFGGGGIESYGADFVVVEDNHVNANSWHSPFDNSGLSFYQNRDTQPGYAGYRFVVRRNISTHNENRIPCICNNFTEPTDGNGIIIDDSKNGQSDGKSPINGIPQDFGPYTGKTLVANNIVYDNFGRGIHVFESDNVNVINNTSFSNSYGETILQGEISVMNSDNVRVYNNIAFPNPYRPAITNKNYRSNVGNRNIVIDYNLTFGGTGFFDPAISDPIGSRNNLVGVNPKFLGATYTNGRDFRLQLSSPAIDKGSSSYVLRDDIEKSLRPKGAGVDMGAYEMR